MEFYSFKWEAKDNIQTGTSEWLKRSDLKKYPDLLKRFDNIRPTKLEISLTGKNGNNTFVYTLPDWKILYTKSGVLSKNLSPGSPENWNEFWSWGWGLLKQSEYNVSPEEFKRLSESEQKLLINKLKGMYLECSQIYLEARVSKIEWPKYEINDIVATYKRYIKENKEPSPLEEVAEAEKEIANETTYTKDDLWGEVANIEEPELEIFEEGYKFGVRYKKSSKIIIPPSYNQVYEIKEEGDEKSKLKPRLFKAYKTETFNDNSCVLFDQSGKIIMSDIAGAWVYFKKYTINTTEGKKTRIPENFEYSIEKFISSSKEGRYITDVYQRYIYDENFNLIKEYTYERTWI
jgi:hypothetical protein